MKRLAPLLALLLGACATLGSVNTATDPNLAERIGGFAIGQQLPQYLGRVAAAEKLLLGGKSLLTEIEAALVSEVSSPRDRALLQYIIDTGALSAVLPDLGAHIDPTSAAGKSIEAAFAGFRLGAATASPKTEAVRAEADIDLSLALGRYRAAKYFAAHPK